MHTITYPGGTKTVTYTYDATNKMQTVTDWNGKTTNYNYRADGQLDYVLYPNSVKTSYSYDNAGRPSGLSVKRNNGDSIAVYSYSLDPLGNHIQENIKEPYPTYPTISGITTNYTYTNANRIQTAGTSAFNFDSNGNTTSKTGYTYGYDVLNNLTSVTGNLNATYVYDGAGNRREATRSGTNTKYVLDILGMSNVLMETDAGGTPQNYYVYGLGLISRVKPSNITEYYVYDYRGSTVAMVDATINAAVTHKYQYDDFGKVLQIQEPLNDSNPFRYIGKYGVIYEDSTLQYMRARYYDPSIGRFLSEDPVWSTNLYPYVHNNPLKNIDPQGTDNLLAEFGWDVVNNYLKTGKTYSTTDAKSFAGSKLVEEGVKDILGKSIPTNTAFAIYETITEKSSALEKTVKIIEGVGKDAADILMPGCGGYVFDIGVIMVGSSYDKLENAYFDNIKNRIKKKVIDKKALKKWKSDPVKYKKVLDMYYSH